MSKPQITTKASKQLALTYNELDQNFINLRDSTIGFTVGSSTATIDLNSALTITAGTNITLALNTVTKTLTINSQGGVQSVSGTTGRITSTGGDNPILDLATTGVTAATYNNASVTVDNFGRITSASSKNLFTTFRTGGDGVVVTPTTASDELFIHSAQGTLRFTSLPANNAVYADLVPTGVTAGIYVAPTITVDQFGRIITVGSTSLGNAFASIAVTGSGTITANNSGATATFVGQNGVGITANVSTRTLTYSLTNTGVTAGNYTNPNFSVDSFGRITSASSGIAITYSETTIGDGGTSTTSNIDLRNGTNTTLLSSVRNTMLFKLRNNVNFFLPNYQNLNNQYSEFKFIFVRERGLSSTGIQSINFQTQSDNLVGTSIIGSEAVQFDNNNTISGTTTISSGSVTSATVTSGLNNYGFNFVGDSFWELATVTINSAPPGGTTAKGRALWSGNRIVGVEITDPGSGYTTAPTFTITVLHDLQRIIRDENGIVYIRAIFIPSAMTKFKNQWIIEPVMAGKYSQTTS